MLCSPSVSNTGNITLVVVSFLAPFSASRIESYDIFRLQPYFCLHFVLAHSIPLDSNTLQFNSVLLIGFNKFAKCVRNNSQVLIRFLSCSRNIQ